MYPLECRKKNLSNPTELQAAIEGNKREGRRGSYGSFPSSDMMPLPHHALGGIPGMPSQISPMSLVTSHQRQFNGNHGMPPSKLSCRLFNNNNNTNNSFQNSKNNDVLMTFINNLNFFALEIFLSFCCCCCCVCYSSQLISINYSSSRQFD